jgi:aryl sulfotransferase
MSALRLPRQRHVYQNHTIDSTLWDDVVPRDDDIVIATPYKCGTTWMQGILTSLVLGECHVGASPWVDFRPQDRARLYERLEQQEHRRILKTHLPLDGLPWRPRTKYVVVSRDPRDVFMSLWNHYRSYTDAAYAEVNDTPGRIGPAQPRCPEDVREFWRWWIGRGWFDWESEGYPFWSNLRHVATWWDFRQLPNILFVHYNQLQAEIEPQILRLADFLGIPLDDGAVERVAAETTLDAMRERAGARARAAEEEGKKPTAAIFAEGVHSFYYKGTNGRWRGVLTDDDLELYEAAARRELTPELRRWLEEGRLDEAATR